MKRAVSDGGYQWNQALDAAFATAIATPATRVRIDQMLAAGHTKNVPQFIQQTLGAVTVDYDVVKAKERVASRLAELGFTSTPEIDKMLDALSPQLLQPATFESYLLQMQNQQDAQVMQSLASALRVSPVPVPKPDVDKLLAAQGQTMRAQLEAASVDPASVPDVEAFLRKAASSGATLYEMRMLVQQLASNPQQRLDQLATTRSVPGGAPRLKPSFDKVLAQAQAYLKNHYVLADDAFKDFLKKAIANKTPQEAMTFAQQLGSDPATVTATEAKRLGVAAPKLAWDMTAIHTMMQPHFTNARIAFDDGMKKFFETCLGAGVPPAILTRVVQVLASQPLPQALKSCGIDLVGVQLPDVKHDVAAVEQWVHQGLASVAFALPQTQQGAYFASVPSRLKNTTSVMPFSLRPGSTVARSPTRTRTMSSFTSTRSAIFLIASPFTAFTASTSLL